MPIRIDWHKVITYLYFQILHHPLKFYLVLTPTPPFAQEMDEAQVDWQVHYFGHAQHAFTDPNAADIGAADMGRIYDSVASERSWTLATQFFQEVFTD